MTKISAFFRGTAVVASLSGLSLSGFGIISPSLMSAQAADMSAPPPPVIESPSKSMLSELGSGWYLRGDLSYVKYDNPKARYAAIDFQGEKLKEGYGIGGGLGYKFMSWFRSDVTVDYRYGADYSARTSIAGCCSSQESGKITTWSTLVNGYIDLGNWGGFSPYIGAGVGAGGGRFKNYTAYNYNNFGVLTSTSTFGSKDKTNLAWALMGGVGIDVGYGFTVDVGYRYLKIGDIASQTDVLGNSIRLKDNASHEVRVGLRYMIE
jgi:opacity protein-like surface antigen